MSSGMLALLIFMAILAQMAVFLLYRYNKHKQNYQKFDAGELQDTAVQPSDLRVAPVASRKQPAWEGLRHFIVHRRVMEDTAESVCSFYLVPIDGQPLPLFKPGQFLTFNLQIPDPATGDIKDIVRCYSLSDRPRPDYYRVTIKRLPPPLGQPDARPGVASSFLHDFIPEGTQLSLRPPSGHFHLTEEASLPIVLVAGGIGLTPMLSIVSTLLNSGNPREIWLFYGVRNGTEHVMKELLLTLDKTHPNFHLHICYSRPSEQDEKGIDYQHLGHVDIERLRLSLPQAHYQFYVCGPRAMMESLVPALAQWGVATDDIYYEAFGPASLPRHKNTKSVRVAKKSTLKTATVTFSKSSTSLPWTADAGSLLEFAEDNGIKVDSGCRAGSCGSCLTRLEHGEVEYSQDPDAEIEPGHCLLCISTPTCDLTLGA